MGQCMQLHSQPLVSVVFPVFNTRDYLIDAIASIVEQSFRDWQLICVNDGSSDGSTEILDWFATQDPRIKVFHQANAGSVAAVKRGCALATAPLMCRMDCDDIAIGDRLEKQVEFLRQHPECCVVGGAILEMDSDSDPLGVSRLPTRHDELVDNLLHRRTGLFHPATMFRAQAYHAVGGYRDQYEWVEDHDLWLRMAQHGQLANLQDVVLCYRLHAKSICWQRSAEQRVRMNGVLREAYAARGRELPQELLMQAGLTRSAAGPGKWARAAAKGGYQRTLLKHLGQLVHSTSSPSYKLRMTAESLGRLPLGLSRRLLTASGVQVPRFPQWHGSALP